MKKRVTRTLLCISAMGLILSGCGKKDEAATEADTQPQTVAQSEAGTEAKTEAKSEAGTEAKTEAKSEAATEAKTEAKSEAATEAGKEAEVPADMKIPEGYHLVWHDEFEGTKLNEADWNYEEHEVGWVNNELQEYVPSDKYAFVKDGELVIQPTKELDEYGVPRYTSGRVNTQNKHDIKYGWIEARLKVPTGKGFLPAFWMMPQDEDFYGQWPKCGEIDIMEVLGNSTTMNYGTLHYGEPHKQNQGSYILDSGNFADEYHTFAVEWEPGVIRWYVDGNQYFETSDWFSAVSGEEEKAYPAPFNQPFHVILNVAVGGDWPGKPDDSTPFDDRGSMHVDYVRMFQKDSYDENVQRPVKEIHMKDADETGNFITNGDFSEAETLTDDDGWKFLQLNDGKGSAEIRDGEITITTENFGTEEYSVQLVQTGMPMIKGKRYKVSFEAKADEDRRMKVAVTAPNVDWIRYLQDTPVDLTTDWQKYEYEFNMIKDDDDSGRVEFNMGNQKSTATIHIKNVRLEHVDGE